MISQGQRTAQPSSVSMQSINFRARAVPCWLCRTVGCPYQSKSAEQCVNVRNAPNIAQCLGALDFSTDFFNISESRQYGTPGKTFAVLASGDPQLLSKFAVASHFQIVSKWQAGKRCKWIIAKSNNAVPKSFLGGIFPQALHSYITALAFGTGAQVVCSGFGREVQAFAVGQVRRHRGCGKLHIPCSEGDSVLMRDAFLLIRRESLIDPRGDFRPIYAGGDQ